MHFSSGSGICRSLHDKKFLSSNKFIYFDKSERLIYLLSESIDISLFICKEGGKEGKDLERERERERG